MFLIWINFFFLFFLIIIIIYHDFLHPPRRGSHVKSDNTLTIIKHTPISPYTWQMHLAFQFSSHLIPAASWNSIPLGDNHQSTRWQSKRTQGQAKMAVWNPLSYMHTRDLHGFRSFMHCHAASTIISLLPKATLTPSIQPNHSLPRTHPPLTSAINRLLTIQYSSILSTCPNHLNTLWSALLTNSLSIPAIVCTSSFLTLSNHVYELYPIFIPNSIQTSQTLYLKNIHFLLSALLIPQASALYNAVSTITPSYRRFLSLRGSLTWIWHNN